MKNIFLILSISFCIFSCNSVSVDCSKYKGQDLIKDFDVEQLNMNSAAYQKYMANESANLNNQIDLQVSQDDDIMTISFIKLGGQADIQCVEVITDRKKIDIFNYESNFAKEITVRRIEYKIHNTDKYELGKIDFRFFK